jgi:hypothetical protein
MLIGHLGVGMALRTWARKAEAPEAAARVPGLGVWFAAVLAADLLCFPLTLLGVEIITYAPDFTPHFPYRLLHGPWSHSAAGLTLVGALAAAVARVAGLGATTAILLGLAVFSHFPTDVIVHGPDMAWAFEPPSLGFALWNHPWISETLELVILAAGTWFMLKHEPHRWNRRFRIFLGGLLVAQAVPSLAPPIANTTVAALSGLGSMTLLAFWGWWGSRKPGNL